MQTNADRQEHIEFWNADEIDTLHTYKGRVRVIRAAITKPDKEPTSWCFAIIGQRARKVSRRTALKIVRARWHLEDTAFNQWSNTGTSPTCLGTRRMLCWPSCCFGRWLSICCSCLSIAG